MHHHRVTFNLIYMYTLHALAMQCSVTCGIGVQERTVTCNIITGNYTDMYGITKFNLTVVNDSLCDDELMPVRSKECRTPRCFYHWLPGPFGEVRIYMHT